MSGAAAWLAITTPVSIGSVDLGFGALQMDRWETLAGAIVCAGAALLPDISRALVQTLQSTD